MIISVINCTNGKLTDGDVPKSGTDDTFSAPGDEAGAQRMAAKTGRIPAEATGDARAPGRWLEPRAADRLEAKRSSRTSGKGRLQ